MGKHVLQLILSINSYKTMNLIVLYMLAYLRTLPLRALIKSCLSSDLVPHFSQLVERTPRYLMLSTSYYLSWRYKQPRVISMMHQSRILKTYCSYSTTSSCITSKKRPSLTSRINLSPQSTCATRSWKTPESSVTRTPR